MANRDRARAALLVLGLALSAQAESTVKAIAANGNHSLALDSDGTVWEWGLKWSAPRRVGGLTGIVSVTAGLDYGLAVMDDGTVWAWGANDVGQLGDGTTTSRPTPARVTGLTDVIGVSAFSGWPDSVAVKSDGTVWIWGPMWESGGSVVSPPKEVAGLSGVVAVSGGTALRADGTVWLWGSSDGPRQVTGLAGIVAIAGSLALKYDGTVWNWLGFVTHGVERVNGIDGIAAISGTRLHYLALKRDGTVWSWNADPFNSSANMAGQLGDGTTESRTTPGQVSGLMDVIAAAAGGLHSLALKSDGTVWAWGSDLQGQLGTGRPTWRSTAGAVTGLNEVAAIAGGAIGSWTSTGSYSFALTRNGAVWVWGQPYMSDTYRPAPEPVVSRFDGGVAIADYAVLKDDGTVWTWTPGWYPFWARGTQPTDQPVQVSGLDGAVAIAPGMALKNDGTVWAITNPPVQAPGLEGIVGIASADLWNLAAREDGAICEWLSWLPPTTGQVSEFGSVVAVAIGSYTLACPWRDDLVSACPDRPVATAYRRALALKADGTVWAWGETEEIQSPLPAITRTAPVQVVGLRDVARVVTTGLHSLALKRDGSVWAWGQNDSGQLGDGTTTSRTAPVKVAGLTGVVAIAASNTHSLALRSDGTVWAWGQNDSGQLGDGRPMIRTSPVQVIQPGSPDLSIEMSHNGAFVAGAQGVYLLTVRNTGLKATAGMVTVYDILPAGLTYVSAVGDGWTCSAADQDVNCSRAGPIDSGASTAITLTVSVSPSAAPGVTNLATVSNEADRNNANNSIGDPTVVLPLSL